MTKMFYRLEDYFDVQAQQRRGFMKWFGRGLRMLFGFVGDLSKSRIDSVSDSFRDADVAR
ncbi:MAG: hypothetical protein K2Y42_15425 [Hyphomicrobium sp.]|jgi:hypothetical protein|uniref:hypothetical protein n=1 Tax=Hyphomicrobium sp. TaxID=82 RepID=UPI0025BD6BC2|nr:hypothetical protein [Hyphomicrobium sp.]MBX9864129.1 hypothetical protein [Hyphomicrobium sp.]